MVNLQESLEESRLAEESCKWRHANVPRIVWGKRGKIRA